jgi:hypothetical protein
MKYALCIQIRLLVLVLALLLIAAMVRARYTARCVPISMSQAMSRRMTLFLLSGQQTQIYTFWKDTFLTYVQPFPQGRRLSGIGHEPGLTQMDHQNNPITLRISRSLFPSFTSV